MKFLPPGRREEVAQYMDLTERFLLALRERAAKL